MNKCPKCFEIEKFYDGYKFYRCEFCGFGIKNFKKLTKEQEENKERLIFFAKNAKGKILDVGCGWISNPYLINSIGIDLEFKNKPKNYKKLISYNLNDGILPFKNEYFDTIIAGEFIEHINNPYNFISECHRVLKRNGKLILSTPNPNYYWYVLQDFFLFLPYEIHNKPYHKYIFNRRVLLDVMRWNEFKELKTFGTELKIIKTKIKISMLRFPQLSHTIIYEGKKI